MFYPTAAKTNGNQFSLRFYAVIPRTSVSGWNRKKQTAPPRRRSLRTYAQCCWIWTNATLAYRVSWGRLCCCLKWTSLVFSLIVARHLWYTFPPHVTAHSAGFAASPVKSVDSTMRAWTTAIALTEDERERQKASGCFPAFQRSDACEETAPNIQDTGSLTISLRLRL